MTKLRAALIRAAIYLAYRYGKHGVYFAVMIDARDPDADA
jgi:hypothetical protein